MKQDSSWIKRRGKKAEGRAWANHKEWQEAKMPEFVATLDPKTKKKNKGKKRVLWWDDVKAKQREAAS
jgi:hypothetical protein